MLPLPGDQDDEVVGVPDQTVVGPALSLAALPLDLGAHLLLPRGDEVIIQRGQGDVGQQRGQDPALRGAGVRRLPRAGGGHHPGLEERLDQPGHALVADPRSDPVQQRDVIDPVEARLDVGLQHPVVDLVVK
nr:hypothetical protein [Ornithinimicrobium flavum]